MPHDDNGIRPRRSFLRDVLRALLLGIVFLVSAVLGRRTILAGGESAACGILPECSGCPVTGFCGYAAPSPGGTSPDPNGADDEG